MNRGQLQARLLPTRPGGDCPERTSGRTTICRNTPSNIMPPARNHPGPSAEVSLGVRGHTPALERAHAPPTPRPDRAPPASMPTGDTLTHTTPVPQKPQQTTRLTGPAGTSKQVRGSGGPSQDRETRKFREQVYTRPGAET